MQQHQRLRREGEVERPEQRGAGGRRRAGAVREREARGGGVPRPARRRRSATGSRPTTG